LKAFGQTVFDFEATAIDGTSLPLQRFRGQVLLVVNVASRCGFTPQYRELEELYCRYRDDGLVVLGFPCDQFGRQEPGTSADILEFCVDRYGVTFPLFAKVVVNGDGTHPLFAFLKVHRPGLFRSAAIKWNFTKFLVGRDGHVLGRYSPRRIPVSIEPDIQRALAAIPEAT